MTAAQRKTPTQSNGGSDNGVTYTDAVDTEIGALWKCVPTRLTGIGGSANAITATSDTALVAAITAYAQPMTFWLTPTADNTAATQIDIDTVGFVDLTDSAGAALQGGELANGTRYLISYDGSGFRAAGVTAGSASALSNAPTYIAQDQKTSGTAGGSATSGSWQTRTLNTEVRNAIAGASLASSQITLPAGTYYAEWSSPGYNIDSHQTRLKNATDNTVLAYGETAEAANGVAMMTRSRGSGYFTITSSKAIQVEHRCATSITTDGFGFPSGFGNIEVYTEIRIWKN